jgi:hypothetical protein
MQTDAHNMGREERRAQLEQRRAAVARQLRRLAIELTDSAADLAVRSRIYTHPHIHRHGAIAGIASRRASALHPSSHPSSP